MSYLLFWGWNPGSCMCWIITLPLNHPVQKGICLFMVLWEQN